MKIFKNRLHAGQLLAAKLNKYKNALHTLIFALPRGGVPVAFEIAKRLHLPLDVCLVRKLGVPGHEELAMGAIAGENVLIFNNDILNLLHLTEQQINPVIVKERRELARRNKAYRNTTDYPRIEDKSIILVDDGLATGATMHAAITAIKQLLPAKIIIAVPVGSPEICRMLQKEVDEIICLATPESLDGVGMWYEDFSQTTDEEVIKLLNDANRLLSLEIHG